MPYQIPPPPAIVDPLLRVSKVLTSEQADALRELSQEYITNKPDQGRVGFETYAINPDIRVCTVSWLPFPDKDERTEWVYRACTDAAQHANATFWQLDLWGFVDMLHCIRYDVGGHFQWHRDNGEGSLRPQRKLSFSLLLTDPSEYEGGDFQIFEGGEQTLTAKDKGTMIVFPSWLQHRVTPVTKGTRHALVGWICGPKPR